MSAYVTHDLSGVYEISCHLAVGQTLHAPGSLVKLDHATASTMLEAGSAKDPGPEYRCPTCDSRRPCSVVCFVRDGYPADRYEDFVAKCLEDERARLARAAEDAAALDTPRALAAEDEAKAAKADDAAAAGEQDKAEDASSDDEDAKGDEGDAKPADESAAADSDEAAAPAGKQSRRRRSRKDNPDPVRATEPRRTDE